MCELDHVDICSLAVRSIVWPQKWLQKQSRMPPFSGGVLQDHLAAVCQSQGLIKTTSFILKGGARHMFT